VTVTGFVLWTAYGALLGSWPVWGSNAVNLALAGTILCLRWRYGRASRVDSGGPDRKTARPKQQSRRA